MNQKQVIKEVQKLREILVKANEAYYQEAAPLISDKEYDELIENLRNLEETYGLSADHSPTARIGGKPQGSFPIVKHAVPMLSLANTYSRPELDEFDQRVRKILGDSNYTYYAELKYDGMAIRLRYEYGKLVLGATRGDGYQGDDITTNIRTIRDIPLKLTGTVPDELEIRGEAFMEKKAFAKMNALRKENGESLFANPRNAAAGSLKLLDPSIVSKRPINMFCYDLLTDDADDNTTQSRKLDLLSDLGLPVCKHRKSCKNIDDVHKQIEQWEIIRKQLPYDTDGVVVKINEDRYREALGQTAKAPRWAIAYKFEAEQAISQIKDITLQVGRLGTITPVAELEPVPLAGTTVKRATLHNEEEIKRKDIRIGDQVTVEKAGDIIPQVTGVVLREKTARGHEFTMPETCPACGSQLAKLPGEVAWRCSNNQCPPQIRSRLEHFASRDAMDIDGLGPSVIDQLVSAGLVRTFTDFYHLKADRIAQLDRMAEKSARNLVSAIEKSKEKPFEKVLYALGIRFVGITVARDLATHFKSLDELIASDMDTLLAIPSIGPRIAASVIRYFEEPDNREIIYGLKKAGLQFEIAITISSEESFFNDMTFVLTGTLPTLKRNDAKDLIEKHGGRVSSSVSKNTSMVLAGEEAGSKLEKAKELNIKIINEEDFLKMIK